MAESEKQKRQAEIAKIYHSEIEFKSAAGVKVGPGGIKIIAGVDDQPTNAMAQHCRLCGLQNPVDRRRFVVSPRIGILKGFFERIATYQRPR